MIRKRIVILMFIVIFLVLVSGCNENASSNEQQVDNNSDENVSSNTSDSPEAYHIQFAHILAEDHPYHIAAEKWKEIVETESDGRITVDLYPNSQLGGERDLQEGLQYNSVQAAIIGGTLGILEPAFLAIDLPFAFEKAEDAHAKLDGELGNKLFELIEEQGIKGLAWWENGFRNITHSDKPIRTPQDVQGMKIRVPEVQAYVSTFETLGANPTPMPLAELFTSLEQGVIDGQENPIPIIYTSKFYEVQDYVSLTRHFYGPAPLVMSLEFYNSLPNDLQAIIDEASVEVRDYERQLVAEQTEEYKNELEANGMTIIEDVDIEAFRKATEPVYDEFQNVIGKEILDLLRE